MTSRSSARPSTARERGLGFGGIAHQPDHDVGAGFIGDHVGRAAAGERADVQRARPQQRSPRAAECGGYRPGRRSVCGWRNRPVRGRPSAPSCRWRHLVAQRAFGSERQAIVAGGLAVDDVARAARRPGRRGRRRRCCAPRPPRTAGRCCGRRLPAAPPRRDHAAMMPLVSQAPRPQMCSLVFARGEEGRHGVHVGGKRDGQLVAPLREDVEAARFHFDALHVAAKRDGQRRQDSRRGSCRPAPRYW
jgi:hypothetical protein